jgi:hypothetical protein
LKHVFHILPLPIQGPASGYTEYIFSGPNPRTAVRSGAVR